MNTSLHRKQEVVAPTSNGQPAIKSVHQVIDVPNYNSVTSIQASPAPAAASFAATNPKYVFRVNQQSLVGLTRKACLRLDVLETGGGTGHMAPCPYMIQRIEYKLPGGKIFQTEYADTAFLRNCMFEEVKNQNHRDLNVSKEYYRGTTHKVSTQRSYRMKLLGTPIFNHQVVNDIRGGDMIMEITFQAIVANGSSTVSLQDIYLEVETEMLHSVDMAEHQARHGQTVAQNYLDVVRIQETGQTLTAGAQYKLDLDVLNGKDVPALMFCVRADGYGASADGYLKTLSLGENATIDLLDSNGKSVYGNGTPVKANFIMHEQIKSEIDNASFIENRRWYCLSFANTLSDSINHGVKDGYMKMSSNLKLAIVPDAAGVAEVQTVTLANAANDGGSYRLAFGGDVTDSLAFNANVAAMKAAFEALPVCRNWPGGPLTATFSGTAAATFTVTFGVTDVQPSDLVGELQVISDSLADGGVAEAPATAVTTYGQGGWTTGSTYTVDVYGFHWREWKKNAGRVLVH